jgi:hypothetical protein
MELDITQHGGPYGGGSTPKSYTIPFSKAIEMNPTPATQTLAVAAYTPLNDLYLGGTDRFFVFIMANATGHVIDKSGNVLATPAHAPNKYYARQYPVRRPNGDDLFFVSTHMTTGTSYRGPIYKFSQKTNSWSVVFANTSQKIVFFSVDKVNEHVYILQLNGDNTYNILKVDFNGTILQTSPTTVLTELQSNQPPLFLPGNGGLHLVPSSGSYYREYNIATGTFLNTTNKVYIYGSAEHIFVDDNGVTHFISGSNWLFTKPNMQNCNVRLFLTSYTDSAAKASVNDYGDGIFGMYNIQSDPHSKYIAMVSTAYGQDTSGMPVTSSYRSLASINTYSTVFYGGGCMNDGSYCMYTLFNGATVSINRGVNIRTKYTSPKTVKGVLVNRFGSGFKIKEGAAAAVDKKSGQRVTINANTTELIGITDENTILLQ